MSKILYEKESYIIRGVCFEIYKEFRNRHKEKVYNKALCGHLKRKGLSVEQEKQIPIFFKGERVGVYVPDIIVENKILLELRCKPFMSKDDIAQFWYYLKAIDFTLGFLINFGAKGGVEIIRRVHSK